MDQRSQKARRDRDTIGQTLRLNERAWKQLKHLAVDQCLPAHELLIEAVNDLFRKHGKKPEA